jgi:hypothetical protein
MLADPRITETPGGRTTCSDCGRVKAQADTLDEGLCEVEVSYSSRSRRASSWNRDARVDCLRADLARRAAALEALAWRARVEPMIEAIRADVEGGMVYASVRALLAAAKEGA